MSKVWILTNLSKLEQDTEGCEVRLEFGQNDGLYYVGGFLSISGGHEPLVGQNDVLS